MVLLGLLMKRLGEGKGLRGERQEEEKGLEGEGGTQVPVYTARWGLGAMCWPGCGGEKDRVQWRVLGRHQGPDCPLRTATSNGKTQAWLPPGSWEGFPKSPMSPQVQPYEALLPGICPQGKTVVSRNTIPPSSRLRRLEYGRAEACCPPTPHHDSPMLGGT